MHFSGTIWVDDITIQERITCDGHARVSGSPAGT
jgi:hypothetical protein